MKLCHLSHTNILYLAMLVLLPKLNLFSIIVPRFRCKLKHISVSLLYRHQRSDYDCLYLPSCLDYCITCPFSFTPLHPELSVVHHYTMQDLLVAVGLLLTNPSKVQNCLRPETPRTKQNYEKIKAGGQGLCRYSHDSSLIVEENPAYCTLNIMLSFQKQDDKKLGCHWWNSCCNCSWSICFVGPNYREEEEKER